MSFAGSQRGKWRRAMGELSQTIDAMQLGLDRVDASAAKAARMRRAATSLTYIFIDDLVQGRAGSAGPTLHAYWHCLRADDPAGLVYGWDMLSAECQARWRHTLETERPFVLVLSMPCTLWNPYTTCINCDGGL